MNTNFQLALQELRESVIAELESLLLNNDNNIKIPLYIDEDSCEFDTEELIEDNYDIRTDDGNGYNLKVHIDHVIMVYTEIISVEYRNHTIEIVTKDRDSYFLSDVPFIEDIISIYEKVCEKLNE